MAANSAAARREARRRRILENSENRLNKITGRYESGSNVNVQHLLSTESENSPNCKVQKDLLNGTVGTENFDKNAQDCFQSAGSKYAEEILRRVQNQNNLFTRFDEQTEDFEDDSSVKNESAWQKPTHHFVVCDLYFIYLAFIVRTLFEFRMANFFFELMFLPFLFLLIPREIVMLREENTNVHKLVAGSLILMGLPHYLVAPFIKSIIILSDVVGTLAIYLVAFTATDCAITLLTSSNIPDIFLQ